MFARTMSGTRAEYLGRFTWGAESSRSISNPGSRKRRLPSSSTARAGGAPQSPRMSSPRWATQTSCRWPVVLQRTRPPAYPWTNRLPRDSRRPHGHVAGDVQFLAGRRSAVGYRGPVVTFVEKAVPCRMHQVAPRSVPTETAHRLAGTVWRQILCGISLPPASYPDCFRNLLYSGYMFEIRPR